MHIEVPTLPAAHLLEVIALNAERRAEKGEDKDISLSPLQSRIAEAHKEQTARAGKANAELTSAEIKTYCQLDNQSQNLFLKSMEKWGLSARSTHRILKVARTIADLNKSLDIKAAHLSEALQYRAIFNAA
jgi:magnesium chelatase family protein